MTSSSAAASRPAVASQGTAKPPAGDLPRMFGARIFVTVIFALLGLAFIASTALLIQEFRDLDWPTLILAHSHLYLFFPTFGILALAAFRLPSIVFTHLYWTRLAYGKLRFCTGFAVVIVASWLVSTIMLGLSVRPRAIWEVAPGALVSDSGEPGRCLASKAGCQRGPMLGVVQSLREKAQDRIGISKFARTCMPDPLLEVPDENQKPRWCFPAGTMLTAGDCCKAQARFADTVAAAALAPGTRSTLATADAAFQPMKTFFVIVVLVIGVMLVVWRGPIETHYATIAPRLERHVMIGGAAMLLWPIMDYAYLDTSNALFGRWTDDVQLRLSLVAAPWALLLLFYFLRRLGRDIELVGQVAGIGASAVALLIRDEIKDWSVRLVGIGIAPWGVGVLLALWVAGFVLLARRETHVTKPSAT